MNKFSEVSHLACVLVDGPHPCISTWHFSLSEREHPTQDSPRLPKFCTKNEQTKIA